MFYSLHWSRQLIITSAHKPGKWPAFYCFSYLKCYPTAFLSLASYLIFDDPPPRPSQILIFTRKIAHGACCGGSYTHRLWCDPGDSRIAGSTQGPSEYLQFLLRSGKAGYRIKGSCDRHVSSWTRMFCEILSILPIWVECWISASRALN